MPIPCQSQITEVTVHARGALVTRRVTLPGDLPDGDIELIIPDVTLLCEAGSVRASLTGSARTVVAVRTSLEVPAAGPLVADSVTQLRALVAEIDRLGAERTHLLSRRKGLLDAGLNPQMRAAFLGDRVEARVQETLACALALTELAAEVDARLSAIDTELTRLGLQRDALALEQAQGSTTTQKGTGHPSRQLHVQLAGSGAVRGLSVTYAVMAARFWPVYTLRLSEGGRRGEFLMEALVAQLTGEDWSGVRLSLSTADLLFDARLPELLSLRFSRVQAQQRKAYRPPPAGLDLMFQGHDRVFGGAVAPPPRVGGKQKKARPRRDEAPADEFEADDRMMDTGAPPPPQMPAEIAYGAPAQEGSARAEMPALPKGGRGRSAGPPPAPMMQAMPMAPGAAPPRPSGAVMSNLAAPVARGGGVLGGMFGGGGGGGGFEDAEEQKMAAPPAPPPEALEPAAGWLDFDALRLPGPSESGRGRLLRLSDQRSARLRDRATSQIESLSPDPKLRDPKESRGTFDHRYPADGLCDVGSDGLTHRVALGRAGGAGTLRYRAVPREAPEVYGEVELHNPFDAPLLAGPVDVYMEGSLLVGTEIGPTDRGGALRVGLGVEERVRLARNARVEEETAGVLGGSVAVVHTVTIEITSSLGRPAPLELLDRIPVTDDKAIEVRRTYARPEPEVYKQVERGQPVRGGLLFRLNLPPGQKTTVEFQYRVLLPAKSEIIGGNRRE